MASLGLVHLREAACRGLGPDHYLYFINYITVSKRLIRRVSRCPAGPWRALVHTYVWVPVRFSGGHSQEYPGLRKGCV